MSFFEGMVLGLVQGFAEFIPISSSGHLILARKIFGLSEGNGLAIDAVLQLATAFAILIYFRRDIYVLLRDFLRLIARREIERERRTLLFALIVGTIPAVVFGLLLEDYMETVFRNTTLVALALMAGSVLMYFADKKNTEANELTIRKGFFIGIFQVLALMPGISRSGATISGGLLSGLDRVGAARFSFLLALPIILGSGSKKLLDLAESGTLLDLGLPFVLSVVVAFGSGLFAIHFLISYLKKNSLQIFVWYRVVLAIVILLFL